MKFSEIKEMFMSKGPDILEKRDDKEIKLPDYKDWPNGIPNNKELEDIIVYDEVPLPLAKLLETTDIVNDDKCEYGKLESNTVYDIDGDICETDDNGVVYKKNDEVLPNIIFERNGYKYTTDKNGRQVAWEGDVKYTPDNERDNRAQYEAGGIDRHEDDDGGHLVARVLGGSEGNENIVPMRDTINRGDYKRSENEIAEAKKSGKEVYDSGKVIYEGDSTRPSKIERTYTIDGKKTELVVDNVEGSQELLDVISDDISREDHEYLQSEIHLMEEEGDSVSVTSVKKEYDNDGNVTTVTVGIRNESTGEKSYVVIAVNEN